MPISTPEIDTAKATVAFHTLGCKLNFSETATIARDFDPNHYQRVPFDGPADVYVINTCSVTDNADKRFKTLVKKCLKHNPPLNKTTKRSLPGRSTILQKIVLKIVFEDGLPQGGCFFLQEDSGHHP